ncbi:MAG TPA: hypothetical protein VNA25_04050 [Phycisphaerae bacterium]|nr:hypothetical protein [Phycisphaerae bacterium]
MATDATGKGQLTVQARTTLDALPVAGYGGGGLGREAAKLIRKPGYAVHNPVQSERAT